jgi:transcriptional regulator GlxA family with amidase domain
MRSIPVYVVVPPRLLLLDLAGPLEVIRRANGEQRDVHFDVHYTGARPRVHCSVGLCVGSIEPLPSKLPDDAIVIVVGDVEQLLMPANQIDAGKTKQDRADEVAIVNCLRTVVRSSHKLVLICSGAIIAAEAGLLDGYSCTTHYLCCDELALLAPGAKVLANRLYVEDRGRYSSAGIMAGIDLMLHVVGQIIGDSTAAAIARYLVAYLRRAGGDPQLSPWLEGRNHIHPAVHKVQDAIAGNPSRNWDVGKLSRIAGASSRHLSRLFHEHAGMSITDYRNRLRATLAYELISQTQIDVEGAAERAGFGSTRQLRRAWRRLYGTTPREVRHVDQGPSRV